MDLARATIVTAILLVISRLLGFFRDLSIASIFGISEYADVAILISTIPDAIVGFLFTGGLAAAMVPQLVDSIKRFHFSIVTLYAVPLFGVIAVTAVTIMYFGQELYTLVGLPSNMYNTNLAHLLRNTTAIAVCILALGSMFSAYCHSQNIGRISTEATIIFNLLILIFFFISTNPTLQNTGIEIQLKYFILTVLTACVLRTAYILNRAFRLLPLTFENSANTAFDYRNFFFGSLSAFVFISYPIFFRSLYAADPTQTIAEFHYAYKIQEFTILLIISTLNLVYLPVLARRLGQLNRFRITFTNLMCITIYVSCLVSIISYKFPNLIIQLFYGLADLSKTESDVLAYNLKLLSFHMPGFALMGLLSVVASASQMQKQYSLLMISNFSILGAVIFLFSYFFESLLTENAIIITVFFPYFVILSYAFINKNLLFYTLPRLLRKISFLFYTVFLILLGDYFYPLSETYLTFTVTLAIFFLITMYNLKKIQRWLS